ncbi:hypothetical protein [Mycobacterium sp. SMC-8]|uniref:hypothetical protein n=1 Tax=Mycobacterium sp. SMC-8 TaxID=2857060 RepID=UPI0021B1611F|nr:hypothetical protein [Mycobacterium sp. SMC-8]
MRPHHQCAQIRDQVRILTTLRDGGFFDQIAALGDRYNPATNATVTSTLTNVQNAVATLDKAFSALGNPDDLAANLRRLQDGISPLASGAQALATGVRTLADSNIEMLSGMSQIATQLQNLCTRSQGLRLIERVLPAHQRLREQAIHRRRQTVSSHPTARPRAS